MTTWFWYAIVAAVLYGLHQVFTKLAAEHIGDGLGGFVVETTAALTIALYLGWLWMSGKWVMMVMMMMMMMMMAMMMMMVMMKMMVMTMMMTMTMMMETAQSA